MKIYYCTKCGSKNHKALDCNLPDGTVWTPPPSELEEFKKQQAEQEQAIAVKQNEPKLDPPRWPNGPQICTKENLPAFPDERSLFKFMDDHCGSAVRKWKCLFCDCYHYEAKAKAPTGTSSGSGRENNLPKNFKPFISDSTKQVTARREMPRLDELPQHEVKEAAKASTPATAAPSAPRPKPKQIKTTDDGQAGLF